MNNQKGYSLLELVIAIVIIGILTAFALPCYNTLASKARVSVARTDVATISQAVEIYAELHGGVYPVNLNVLTQDGGESRMTYIPLDPWGHVYNYNNITHVVSSYGADNRHGGVSYNTDILSNVQYNPNGQQIVQQDLLQLLQ